MVLQSQELGKLMAGWFWLVIRAWPWLGASFPRWFSPMAVTPVLADGRVLVQFFIRWFEYPTVTEQMIQERAS
jgi:hypothetical protein